MPFTGRASGPVLDRADAAWSALEARAYKTAAFAVQISIALGVAVRDGPKPFVAFERNKQQERL
jgi:hypothetical protein